ncbi:MAG: hypothetical protein KKF26_02605 [Chloroflexi bacterium]|nr:hypothetical protein [Chloroflexota bacterium]
MISLSFLFSLPLFIAAIVIFGYGVARNDAQASKTTMSIGLSVGLVGVVMAAIMFVFFSL